MDTINSIALKQGGIVFRRIVVPTQKKLILSVMYVNIELTTPSLYM